MKNKVYAAIVGLGRWGKNLHEASLQCENLEVTRVVTRSPDKVRDYCDEHGVALGDQIDETLADDKVDALILATPHTQHFDQICAAARSGKHVFSEKPFTLDGDQADRAIELIRHHKLKVGIGHNRRFAPNTIMLKEMIESGELGELLHVDGVFSAQMSQSKGKWRDSRAESPAGGMTSLGIHVVDMLVHLAGNVADVSARSEQIHTACAFDDSTIANLRFRNGATGVLTTLASSPMMWRITIYGTEAWAEMRDLNRLVVQQVEGGRSEHMFDGFDYPGIRSIERMLAAFADDVLGGVPYLVTPEQIAHETHVLGAIIDSSASEKLISLQNV